jgi:pimeloyl-ACP methyl ester carboxylesterase
MRLVTVAVLLFVSTLKSPAQVEYPYPVHYLHLSIENKPLKMAYMDVASNKSNGKIIMLFHGKNFNGYYWKNVIPMLTEKGYRVIVPDQIGWGESDRPDLHYSFQMLAENNKALLDSLHIEKVTVLGHSMGGMLAVRFALMFPNITEKLILEDPIGLEDYKTFVPYKSLEQLYQKEKSATYESYKKYQQGYYPEWKPEYEQYVQAQAEDLQSKNFDAIAWNNALTYQLIYTQPVVYELKYLKMPTLLIVGSEDRTIVGKGYLNDSIKNQHGNYPALAQQAKQQISNCTLILIPGVGHIPHIQQPEKFKEVIMNFLKE